MRDTRRTAKLARRITWMGSKQSYLIGQLLVDRTLRNDFFRAYSYFRWIDDMIDEVIHTRSERIEFIDRQSELIRSIYSNKKVKIENEEEEILLDLIKNDRRTHDGLRSFIEKMFSIIEFDTLRKDTLISEEELDLYNKMLGISVVDGLQYFIGNEHSYPKTIDRYEAAIASHRTHILRDMKKDLQNGIFNIPDKIIRKSYPGALGTISDQHVEWVREQVREARTGFNLGKEYIEKMEILRCKIAASWYCYRFEVILDAIEKDGCLLRESYSELRKNSILIKLLFSTFKIIFNHYFKRTGSALHLKSWRSRQVGIMRRDTLRS